MIAQRRHHSSLGPAGAGGDQRAVPPPPPPTAADRCRAICVRPRSECRAKDILIAGSGAAPPSSCSLSVSLPARRPSIICGTCRHCHVGSVAARHQTPVPARTHTAQPPAYYPQRQPRLTMREIWKTPTIESRVGNASRQTRTPPTRPRRAS